MLSLILKLHYLILKKQENFRKAFDNFNIAKIARYKENKVEKLLENAGIIRNRRKIEAVIHNAKQIPFATFNPDTPTTAIAMTNLETLKEKGTEFRPGFHVT